MKKFKRINTLVATLASIATVAPISIHATSCSNQLANSIYEDAIEEIKGICSIPHVSNDNVPVKYDETDDHLVQIRNYLVQKINNYMGGNVAIVDDARNVYFDIPASKGYENVTGITLQAHMDMVWDAQGEAKEWDEAKHPVSEPVIEEVDGKLVMHSKDWLTSLGADDGQGMGAILSIAKNHNKFKHGFIKCVITADEETTGNGASNLGIIDGKQTPIFENTPYSVTLDLPHGGKVADTSAGVTTHDLTISNVETMPVTSRALQLDLSKFIGGHSGEDIDFGRSSAIKVAAEIIKGVIDDNCDIQLVNFSSTCNAMNKIPTDAKVLFVPLGTFEKVEQSLDANIQKAKEKLKQKGVEINAEIKKTVVPSSIHDVLDNSLSSAIVNLMNSAPFGPYDRFEDDGFVGSSANLAPLNWLSDNNMRVTIKMTYSIRFGAEKWLAPLNKIIEDSVDTLKQLFPSLNVKFEKDTTYFPVWEKKDNNKLAQKCIEAHKKAKVQVAPMKSHGGLETALIVENHPEITAIAIGATDLNEHMVTEQLLLDEYKNLCNVLLVMLTNKNL